MTAPPHDATSSPNDPSFVALHALYDALDAEVARHSPVCRLSGRCCRFKEWDHTLFLSAPEFDVLLAEAPAPSRPLDDGATCPWQDKAGHCTARDARPLGCRIYYCDPDFQERSLELSESFITRLKRIVNDLDLPWNYAPLHTHLRQAEADGRFVSALPQGPL